MAESRTETIDTQAAELRRIERDLHDGAQARYEKERPLYERLGDVLGQANCIARLGDIALARSDHDTARARYEEARPLYYTEERPDGDFDDVDDADPAVMFAAYEAEVERCRAVAAARMPARVSMSTCAASTRSR